MPRALYRLLLLFAACGDKPVGPSADDTGQDDTGPDEQCADGVDNDRDGAVDCADPECLADQACGEDCTDGVDNDRDGAADCHDTDCTGTEVCLEDCTSGVDEDLDGAIDCNDPDCAGTPLCAPVLTGVTPGHVWTDRAGEVVLSGGGFAWGSAGSTTVTFGGVPAAALTLVDQATLLARVPAGLAEGAVDVVLSNNNGTATLAGGLAVVAPAIYSADGKGAVQGSLYRTLPGDWDTDEVGELDYSLTGLAFDAQLNLYAVNSTASATVGTGRLLRIDPTTAATTAVGTLTDGRDRHDAMPDLTFVGDRLLGWSELSDAPVEINPATGGVTALGGRLSSSGSGFAYNPSTGVLFVAPQGAQGDLYQVDPTTGATTRLCTMTHSTAYSINAMTVLDGVLYANISNYAGRTPTDLYTLDPASCALVYTATLPHGVDAIASNRP